jgi:hypothetical protein
MWTPERTAVAFQASRLEASRPSVPCSRPHGPAGGPSGLSGGARPSSSAKIASRSLQRLRATRNTELDTGAELRVRAFDCAATAAEQCRAARRLRNTSSDASSLHRQLGVLSVAFMPSSVGFRPISNVEAPPVRQLVGALEGAYELALQPAGQPRQQPAVRRGARPHEHAEPLARQRRRRRPPRLNRLQRWGESGCPGRPPVSRVGEACG